MLQHMAEGETNGAIAETLVVALSTVEKHVSNIFAKLGLVNEPRLDRRVAAVLTFLHATAPSDRYPSV